jgi:hypothetical protein
MFDVHREIWRRIMGYTLSDRKRNVENMREEHIPQIIEYVAECKRNWEKRIDKMSSI